ncbi:butyrophilin subfamily 1 member A1-like isoform X3 [Saccopteryx bilineata]|uniref:butyrophilin subfamily 1 member A1-like isoform X3 n=1 Tax=Saccopteryx bilineata TaxID=59482 RepID=UPI0033906102
MALQSPASTAVSRAGDCLWATREKYETDFSEKDSLCHGIELLRRNGGGYGVSNSKDDVDTTALYNVLRWLVFCFIVCIFWKEFRQSEELQQKIEKFMKKIEELPQEIEKFMKKIEELPQEIEKFKKKIDVLQQDNDRRKAQYKSVWKNAPLYPDWRKEEFKAVTVTLDAATAHPALHLSENGRQLTWQERQKDLPSSTQRFDSLPCVLGQLHISSGRCYWEVEVGNAHSWDLGVCGDNITRKGRVTMSPQNGFWAIRLYSGEYWALTSPETPLTVRENPLKVGIFLDYEDGDVSFFNITEGSHIFSFSKNTFHGVLRPLFRLWSSDSGSLAICPG